MEKDLPTEKKIKEAARKIFHKKGYAGTRTRDIAEEAGINPALLNYYYRSKEKLFDLVFDEGFSEISASLNILLNDDKFDLAVKIDYIVNKYIDVVSKNPDLPLFILGEIKANPENLKKKLGLSGTLLTTSKLYEQMRNQLDFSGSIPVNPIHIIINILSMTIFPFVGKPLIKNMTEMNDLDFEQFIEERRTLIPMWIKSMLKIQEK
ncbi:MAG: TetR/AcrR family transcriptional regulator [Candidatus Azobacteroides sp.]|nr:TetR/AcrR family transcriptional regulator [Candidatus Azobacteroides sp.]